ncbi:MAG: ATP-dependent sacrificial sulfur transferase LarE, partial [Lachnospiraceae bacterium]|nr:ATP-dependent sacrificial sulfur transferase LarE [Lachnospiraceae bacterium]
MNKLELLKDYIRDKGSMAIAYSSGVDSTFLLKVAHNVLGDNCVAITAISPSFPKKEREEATAFCKEQGIRQILVDPNELALEDYAKNPKNRCYYCKHRLFSQVIAEAKGLGITAVAEGSNVDDLGDYRPGLKAIEELGVLSPLREVGYTKAEIRKDSEALGLPTASKPSFACLASRIPYGERITAEKLARVE